MACLFFCLAVCFFTFYDLLLKLKKKVLKEKVKILFFLFRKNHLPSKQQKFIIIQQGGGLVTLINRDNNGRFGTR